MIFYLYIASVFITFVGWIVFLKDRDRLFMLRDWFTVHGVIGAYEQAGGIISICLLTTLIPFLNLVFIWLLFSESSVAIKNKWNEKKLTPEETEELLDIAKAFAESAKATEINDVQKHISPKELIELLEYTYFGMHTEVFQHERTSHEFFNSSLESALNNWDVQDILTFVSILDYDEHRDQISSLLSFVMIKEFMAKLKNKVLESGEKEKFPRWFLVLK